jgi:hypothetical protein
MTMPVAPELFDILLLYAKDITSGKVIPSQSRASSSPALTFCENFYAQFFQNELGKEIQTFGSESKKDAIRLRLRLAGSHQPSATLQLITWFEKLCDIYPNVLALGYGGGTRAAFVRFHKEYVLTLLERICAWAVGAGYREVDEKSGQALLALRAALKAAKR